MLTVHTMEVHGPKMNDSRMQLYMHELLTFQGTYKMHAPKVKGLHN